MLAERTFWEKATSMHVYCFRDASAASVGRGTGTTSSVSRTQGSRHGLCRSPATSRRYLMPVQRAVIRAAVKDEEAVWGRDLR